MASLTGSTIAASYEQLLALPDGGLNGNNLVAITDGDSSVAIGMKVATNKIEIIPGSDDANAFEVSKADGTAVLTVNTSTVGATLIAPLTVGVNDAGHDVVYYGNAAGALAMWDASEDSFLVRGATADAAGSSGRIVLQTAQVAVEDGDILGRIDFNSPLESSGSDAISVGASIFAEADGTFASGANATELVFGTTTNGAATEKVRITSDGKVGVGNSNPTNAFMVGSSYPISFNSNYPDLHFNSYYDSGAYRVTTAGFGSRLGFAGNTGILTYTVGPNSVSAAANYVPATAVTVLPSGNVGVGTDSPNFTLQLDSKRADATFDANNLDTWADFKIQGQTASGNARGIYWDFDQDTGNDKGAGIVGISGDAEGGVGSLAFITTAGNVGAERMRITSAGRVGIGITPTSPFHVYSSGETDLPIAHIEHGEGNVDAGDEILRLDASSDTDIHDPQLKIITIYDAGGEIGKFTTASNGNINTAWTNISDVRLKKDIQDSSIDGLGIINAIKLRDFKWNAEAGKYRENKQVIGGLIADEVYKVYEQATSGKPGAVKEDGSIDRMGVTESQFITVLMKAVQELSAKVEALENA